MCLHSIIAIILNDYWCLRELYAAISRVTSREWLKILITDEDGEHTNVNSNMVYIGKYFIIYY